MWRQRAVRTFGAFEKVRADGTAALGVRCGRGLAMTAQADGDVWTPICEVEKLPVERGVTALVRGHAVAVFRTPDDHVYAIGNHDPFSRVATLGRGIVGTRGDVPFVASTQARQAFDLRTGRCLDDPSVSVPSYAVRIVDGMVHVGPRTSP